MWFRTANGSAVLGNVSWLQICSSRLHPIVLKLECWEKCLPDISSVSYLLSPAHQDTKLNVKDGKWGRMSPASFSCFCLGEPKGDRRPQWWQLVSTSSFLLEIPELSCSFRDQNVKSRGLSSELLCPRNLTSSRLPSSMSGSHFLQFSPEYSVTSLGSIFPLTPV